MGSIVAAVSGALVATLTMVLLAGWHLHLRRLVQIDEHMPIAYNTGVTSLLLGVAIVLVAIWRSRVAVVFAAGALLFASANLWEHASGGSLGIDTLIFTPDLVVGALPPGRMAPNTAVALFVLAAALLGLLLGARHARVAIVAAIAGALVAALGAAALTGYLAELPAAYGWSKAKDMAPQTAVLLTLLATGIAALSVRGAVERGQGLGWSALLVGAASLTAMLILSRAASVDLHATGIARATLAVGTTLSAALAAAVHFGQAARARAADRQRAFGLLSVEFERRIAAQSELAESQARLGQIVQTVAEGVVLTDASGNITFANIAAERILGLTRALIATRRYDDVCWQARTLDGQPMPGAQLPVGRILAGEEIVLDCRHAIEFPDERSIVLSVGAAPLRSSNGELLGVVASFRDITEQSWAERALRESEDRFRAVFQSAAECIVVWDREYNYLYANEAAMQHVGTTPDRVIGKNIRDGLSHVPEFMNLWIGRVDEVLAHGRAASFEDASTLLGRQVWSESVVSPLRDERGEVYAVSVVYRDVTERRTTAEALRQAHERLRRFIDSNVVGIVIATSDGGIVEANDYYLRLIGRTREELEQGTIDWRAITPPEWLPEDEHAIEELRKSGVCTPYEKEYLRPDGTRVPVFLADTMLSGPEEQIAAFALDISKRRRAENEIRRLNAELERRVAERTASLEASNREMEAFSYSVSHDLRAPLRALDGFSQALLEDCGPTLDETAQDLLGRIRAASQRMGRLIDDLLMLSRLSRTEMRRVPLDVGSMAAEILESLRLANPERSVRVTTPAYLPANGDPHLVAVALDNLLRNSWKFTRKREMAEIEVGAEQREGETVYFVRDNGAGFDMQYADRLFGAFQRLHSASEFEGVGIGLATAARVIHRHGGRIWADAAVDRGACFYFTLPAEPTGSDR